MASELRRPAGDITTQWATIIPPSPTTHYTKVYEEIADEDATIINDVGLSTVIDMYSLPASAIPDGAINITVKITMRATGVFIP